MTVWESVSLISPWQAASAVGLLVLFWVRGPNPVAWTLLGGYVAMLLLMAAMDFGLLVREPGNDQVTRSVLVVWCVMAAVLVVQHGLGQFLAALCAIGIPIFSATLVWGVEVHTTSAITNAIGLVQLVVAVFGSDSPDRGDGRGIPGGEIPLAVPHEVFHLGAGGAVQDAALFSQDRGE